MGLTITYDITGSDGITFKTLLFIPFLLQTLNLLLKFIHLIQRHVGQVATLLNDYTGDFDCS